MLYPPILSRANFAQITSEFHEPRIALDFLPLFPSQDLVDLSEHEQRSATIELGNMGGFLVRKFVKPTKVLGSWPPHESGIDQLLLSQA